MATVPKRPLTAEEKKDAQRLAQAWKNYQAKNPGATQIWLGRETGLGKQSVISQYLNGAIQLNPKALFLFSKVLGVPADSISPTLAATIPKDLGGEDDASACNPNVAFLEDRGRVPLISWVRAGMFYETADPFQPGDAEDYFPCPVTHGEHTYCLRVMGESMNGDDGYIEGEIIFVDPDDKDPRPNKDYVIKTPDDTATFKRLKQEPDGWYMLALNPDWSPRYQRLPHNAIIGGRVIYSLRQKNR